MSFKFSNHYADLGEGFYTYIEPSPLPKARPVIFYRDALNEVGFDSFSDDELSAFFSGNVYPKGAPLDAL